MYDFLDRPVTSLDHGGRFLIWSIRNWVNSIHCGRCPCTVIGPTFVKWKMTAGLPHFHRMMELFNDDALGTFSFAPLYCNRISEHEALIISLVRAMRMSPADTVRTTSALLVRDEAVADLTTAVAALERAMADAGISPGKPVSRSVR